MIFKSSSPISPKVDIVINDVPTRTMSIVQVELDLCENKHDLLRLKIAGIPSQLITDYIDKPVYCYWEFGINLHEFCGYIASIEPSFKNYEGTVNGSPFQLVEVLCVGSSYGMRSKKTKLWENCSIQKVATELADKYKFSVSTIREKFEYPRIVQSEESDWEFLNKVAGMYGLCVSLHGTHLHVWNPMRSLGRQTSYHELKNIKARNGDTSILPATILSMKGVFGDSIRPKTNHSVSVTALDDQGLTYTSNDFNETTGFGKQIDFNITDNVSVNATSVAMAETLVSANNRGINILNADLALTGTAGVLPGGLVNITNFESTFDGLWYVKGVKHTLTRSEFFTHVLVSKKDTNDEYPTFQAMSTPPEPPGPVFTQGSWTASVEMVDYYV
jgi:phage protein D